MEENRKKEGIEAKGEWVTYRPDIKVLDCTIRDGGLMNNHQYDDTIIKKVYQTCVDAGIDYMEMGYKSSKKIYSPTQFGPWKFCDEDALRRILGENKTSLKISVMADAERTDYHTDILPKENSIVDTVRIATYIHQIPETMDMIKDAHDKGYETTVNLMAVSTVQERDLDDALSVLVTSDVNAIYLVDSFGAFYGEQIRDLTLKYMKYAKAAGKEVGIHTHNNQQLAYANTIEALIAGASRLDASIAGLGRGAGNCQMELLLGFLHNPKFNLRPIIQCIQEYIEPLREQLRWGFDIPYMLTGRLNQHPRDAMKFMESNDRKNLVKFFDSIMEEE
ncbi:MAG: nucleoid-structuring protein H-NS [Candidatus Omnitrophica bacterium]|nr:nucleoid-structuring protein H-NS [Candidatus Omnitrophota bacterium]